MVRILEHTPFILLWAVLYALAGCIVAWAVSNSGAYPFGSDTLFHLQKAHDVYESIGNGVWFPLYDPSWYNGVEPLRHWPPLPIYVLAMCDAVVGGSLDQGYLFFIQLCLFLGGISWLTIGIRVKRKDLGGFLGLLWFFMPGNLMVLFIEGNLPRVMLVSVLPLFIYCIYEYTRTQNYKLIPVISIGFFLCMLTHVGYALLLAMIIIVFLILDGISRAVWRPLFNIVGSLLCGAMLTGLWAIPGLIGSHLASDGTEILVGFFQPLTTSLDPFVREASHFETFYFGLAAFILAVCGSALSKRDTIPLFLTGICVALMTTSSMYPIMSSLPVIGQYCWMLRTISVGLTFILLGFLMWNTLKKGLILLFCLLLVIDVVPSLPEIYREFNGRPMQERFEELSENYLITEGRAMTEQRLCLMDESSLGATGAYLASGFNGFTATTFGAGLQAAVTSLNVTQLNKALDTGCFDYLFDRAKELGNDTVLFRTARIDLKKYSFDQLDAAAARSGYSMVQENAGFRLYHLEGATGTWGTISKYEGIGIGSVSQALSLQFPTIEETADPNLNHYTADQLKAYKLVYLSGFTYDDKEAAEELVRTISDAGTRVIISADGIPIAPNSHEREFMGLTCNTISFSRGYPELDTIDGLLNCNLFPSEFADKWQTVYVEGLDKTWGSFTEGNAQFDFYGTTYNEDVVVIGLNLTYFLGLTKDKSVERLLSHAMDISSSDLPERTVVPVQITYKPKAITITTKYDNVNTALASHDIFAPSAPIRSSNNLLYVNSGTTVLSMSYPYFWQGLALSVLGIVLTTALTLALRHAYCKDAHPSSSNSQTKEAA